MKSVCIALLILAGCSNESTPVEQTSLSFSIQGMFCEACPVAITSAIEQIEGVTGCTVSFEAEQAVVHVDDPALESRILEIIRGLHFTAEPIAGQ